MWIEHTYRCSMKRDDSMMRARAFVGVTLAVTLSPQILY